MAAKLTERQKEHRAKIQRIAKAKRKRSARDERIVILREDGVTLESIAVRFGITHQRVAQIINKSKEGGK